MSIYPKPSSNNASLFNLLNSRIKDVFRTKEIISGVQEASGNYYEFNIRLKASSSDQSFEYQVKGTNYLNTFSLIYVSQGLYILDLGEEFKSKNKGVFVLSSSEDANTYFVSARYAGASINETYNKNFVIKVYDSALGPYDDFYVNVMIKIYK